MTEAELERLAILSEEMGEVQQIIAKIIRHGYEGYHPVTVETNRYLLTRELGDLEFAIELLKLNRDIDFDSVFKASESKRERLKNYVYHEHIGLLT